MDQVFNEHLTAAALANQQINDQKMFLVHNRNEDPRRNNDPVNASHLGIAFVGPDGQPPNDVHLRVYGQGIKIINDSLIHY